MKDKLKYLVEVSLKRKFCTKWFLVANIILALIIIAVTNIDSVINFFGGDFNKKTSIYVIDETNISYDILKTQIETLETSISNSEESSYEIKLYEDTEEQAKKQLAEEETSILIKIKSNETNVLDATIISQTYIDTLDYQIINQALQNTKTTIAIAISSISEEELNKLSSPIEIERIILDENKKSENENMETIMTTVFPIVILPFFMLTIFLVQMIGAEINDEKTTRGMEIIISNVSPKVHFFSKVISGNIFIISQGILLIAYVLFGILIRNLLGTGSIFATLGIDIEGLFSGVMQTDFATKMLYVIPLTLVLMIFTFIAYSLLAGVLASMTTNAEDFGQLQTPIMIISLIGYYLAMMAGMFDGSLFIKILSYVPFISAILSPSLLVLGQIGIIDIIASIVIVIITNYLLIHYGLRIYKVGILNYSSKDLWKKMFKAMKEK